MGRELERGSGWGTHVHPWQIQVNVWRNQYNIVKLKKNVLEFSGTSKIGQMCVILVSQRFKKI